MLTTDGGATWADRSAGAGSLPGITGLWFFDRREGLAVASDGSSIRTMDGGHSWSVTAPLSNSYGWQRMQFSSSGNVGWVSVSSAIYRSTDRGRTWLAPVPETSARLPYDIADFHFVDDSNGWAIARYSSSQEALYRSSDGGMSWRPVANTGALQGAAAIRFSDTLNGIALGAPGVAWVTTDGGTSWSARPTGTGSYLRRVTFADASTAVAVGDAGFIVRSTDRGLNWTRAAAPTAESLVDVRFVTSSVGYAVGNAGSVLRTSDAGLTWTLQPTGATQALQSAFFVDEQTGWVGGSNGGILATATAGR
jgi:photosystem II stability/assembly factor-like uncharacterized protein